MRPSPGFHRCWQCHQDQDQRCHNDEQEHTYVVDYFVKNGIICFNFALCFPDRVGGHAERDACVGGEGQEGHDRRRQARRRAPPRAGERPGTLFNAVVRYSSVSLANKSTGIHDFSTFVF